MLPRNSNPNMRTGKFLWMEPHSRHEYICDLKQRIINGYFGTDAILDRIVDELAPVLSDVIEGAPN